MGKSARWTAYLSLSFLTFFLFIFLFREPLSYFVLGNVARLYGAGLGVRLDLGAISGKPFSKTTFAHLTARPAADQPQSYNITVESLSCDYDIWDLRRGVEPFIQGLNCAMEDPVLAYDLRVAPQTPLAVDPSQYLVPATLPGLKILNGAIVLTGNDWQIETANIDAGLTNREAGHELVISAGDFRLNQAEESKIATDLAATLHFSGQKLFIDALELAGGEIRATGILDLSNIAQGAAELEAALIFAESKLNVTGSMNNEILQARINTDNFAIGELRQRLGGSGWDISGKIKADVELDYNLRSPADQTGSFTFSNRNGLVNGVEILAAEIRGEIRNGVLDIAKAEVATANNLVALSKGSVAMATILAGRIQPIIETAQAEFEVSINDPNELLALVRPADLRPPDSLPPGSISLRGKLAKAVFYLDAAKAAALDSTLTITRAEIAVPDSLETFGAAPISISARFASSNLAEPVEYFSNVTIEGQVTADLEVSGTVLAPLLAIELTGDNLAFNGKPIGAIILRGSGQLRQDKPGRLRSADCKISELTQTNGFGALTLDSQAALSWQPGIFSGAGAFRLDGQGKITIKKGQAVGDQISAEISTTNLDSTGWLANFLDNRYFFQGANLEATYSGLPAGPQILLAGAIAKAGATGTPFPMSGSFRLEYSPTGFDIAEFTWKSPGGNQLSLTGHLPYAPLAREPYLDGELSLQGHADFPGLEDIAFVLEPWGINKGSLLLDMDLSGTVREPEGHIHFQARDIASPAPLKSYLASIADLAGDLEIKGGVVFLKSANLESTAYSVQATGSWHPPAPIMDFLWDEQAELKGEVTLDATVKLKDLNFLKKELPWLRRLDGDIRGELHADGPLDAPRISGSFSVRDGEVSHTFNFPMLADVNLEGNFDEHSISIKKMRAELGGSPVNFSGSISKEQEIIALDLHVDGKNVLLFRNNDMRMRGDVQLDVSGPLDHLLVEGVTGLTGGYYTRNIDFLDKIGATATPISEGVSLLFSFPDPPLNNAALNIKITTVEPFKIRNNLIRGVLRPELTLKGTGELPFLLGTIYVDPSRILLPSGRLQIQSGLLRFIEESPDHPQLYILAQSKVLGYEINIIVRGTTAEPIIDLSSSPALANDELLLLLLTGQPPSEDAAGGVNSSGTRNVMVYLGRDFLTKWLEDGSDVNSESILDRLELDFGRGVTNSGELMMESTFRISEQTDQLGKTYYLAAEKDKYDAYNYGLKLVFKLE